MGHFTTVNMVHNTVYLHGETLFGCIAGPVQAHAMQLQNDSAHSLQLRIAVFTICTGSDRWQRSHVPLARKAAYSTCIERAVGNLLAGMRIVESR